MNFKFVYKICNKSEWFKAKEKNQFIGSKNDLADGYIHFPTKEQVEGTFKNFYTNQKNLILLKVATLKLDHLILEQTSDGNMFPHTIFNISYQNIYFIFC